MIRWWEHGEKGVMDGRTDRRTDGLNQSYSCLVAAKTRMPVFWGYPPPPHDYPYHWIILDPKSTKDKVKVTNLKKSRHTFLSCLTRCANMKWIRWVLLKIQSGHDSVHRRTDGRTDRWTDGQGDTSIPPYQLRWSGGIMTQFCNA